MTKDDRGLPKYPRPNDGEIQSVYSDLGNLITTGEKDENGNWVMSIAKVISDLSNQHSLPAIEWSLHLAVEVSLLQASTITVKELKQLNRHTSEIRPRSSEVSAIAATEQFWEYWRNQDFPILPPVAETQTSEAHGIATVQTIWLTLSGGGLRATLFHLGILLYLSWTNRLKTVEGIVSVSGGSITAAYFAKEWNTATSGNDGFENVATGVVKIAVSDIRHEALIPWLWSRLVPIWMVWWPWRSRSSWLEKVYRNHFGATTIDDLRRADAPNVAIVATDAIRKERIAFTGENIMRFAIKPSDNAASDPVLTTARGVPISLAVAASSCFPPVFNRMRLNHQNLGLNYDEFKDTLYLNDGGVTGNLGTEVLLALRGKEGKSIVLICDAEASQRTKPGNSSLTDVIAGQTALSGVSVAHAKSELGDQAMVVSFAKRTEIPGRMAYGTQTKILTFRTDLDSPSWPEIHALILHGASAAAETLEDKTADELADSELVGAIQRIIRAAGGPDESPMPKDSDLKSSHRLPKRRMVIHLLLALLVALIVACTCSWVGKKVTSFATADPVIPEFPFSRPDPMDPKTGCKDRPSAQATGETQVVVPAEDVVLLYRATNDEKIEIAMLDWSRYYAGQRGEWRDLFPGKELKPFEGFSDDSTGWFSFYVRDRNGDYTRCLGTINLFAKRSTTLTVEEKDGRFSINFE